ncbi:MAG: ATPase [Acidimicrobiia bacterium]|nr:ATPase [Acidimicrobiia bacterium]
MDVITECVIARPAHEVAAFAADPDRVPEWYANIRSVEWKTPRPLRVGSQIAFVAHFLGRRLAYTYEVVELDPLRRFVMRTSEGPFPMETTYTWEPLPGESTRMTLRNRGTPAGFSRWVSPFMAVAVRRANQQDLRLLKTILEGSVRAAPVTPPEGRTLA